MYTNNVVDAGKSFILVSDIRDHFPVVVNSNFNLQKHDKSEISYITNTKNFDMELFLKDLSTAMTQPQESPTIEDLETHTAAFINSLKNVLNKHAPLRKRSRKEQKLSTKPWISKEILQSMKKKNLLDKKCMKNNTTEAWVEYKICRNKLFHIKENAKKLHYYTLINENKNNTAKLWKTIKDIITLKSSNNSKIPNKMHTYKTNCVQGPQAVSNLFNNFFTNIGITSALKITKPDKCNLQPISLISCNPKSFFLKPIVDEEILLRIRQLDSTKSSGTDGIPLKYVKMSATIITTILTNLHNHCITKGIFPKVLKIAKVIPIHKKGPKGNLF